MASIRSAHISLLVILGLALGLRLALWSQPLHEPANDEVEYITVARDLLEGRGWSFYERYHWLRAPLYPLFLAASWRLAGDDAWPGATRALHLAALPNIALSVGNVFLTYLLTRRLAYERAAIIAALIAAILWTSATFASLYMAETLFAALFQAGMLFLLYSSGDRSTTIRWPLIAAAGLCFGLATLTRSITLLFLPCAALWLAAQVHRTRDGATRRRMAAPLLAAAIYLGAATLTIAPWTIRNIQAYGGIILVETGLSYNLWVFNEPREDRDTIHQTLERITNPVERADYATRRGLERLREDPAIIARKLWPNWVLLARVKPIQDRFLMESYYADVTLPLFGAALIFDDLLYIIIVLGAMAGLAHAGRNQRGPPFWPALMCLLWIGYAVATMLLTHGEARYRHFLFPVLIPYAAWSIAALCRRAAEIRRQRLAIVAPLAAVFLWTVLTAYPWDWVGENLARGTRALAGDLFLALGDPDRAVAAYHDALEAKATADGWLRLGAAYLARGSIEDARRAYRAAWSSSPLYYVASSRLGDLERTLGNIEQARRAFAGYYVDAQRVTDWSWRTLDAQPPAALDVGDGLDFGNVGGVYPAEELQGTSARWSAGRALLRLAGPETPATVVIVLRLAAPHPGTEAVPATICVANACRTIILRAGWRSYMLALDIPGDPIMTIEVRSPTFVAADSRHLGVLIDSARLIVPGRPGDNQAHPNNNSPPVIARSVSDRLQRATRG
ncbi:MAG: glycosyltransferase family 39 protein [Chloroflexi bacterium]|nr:glycosyltransferase family 39 protein [Chloroflexota bacterium]